MASQKTELKRHIDYLQARRSGAEYCLDKDNAGIKEFVHSLSTSITDNQAKLATIEKREAEEKAAELAQVVDARRRRELA